MDIRIALAGNPNSGKTTLFNALTGSNQFVGNWPGVTVEKKEGMLDLPMELYTPIFAISRIAGWSAHRIEELINAGKIIRPAYRNVVKVMFMKNLFIFLWSLLFVIPGIYKAYQYRMVDYLMAENPYMTYQRALELSRQMTDGEKFNIFILELSFFGWLFLGALACGIGVFFVNPYIEATFAELYAALRAKAFATGMTDASELSDFMRY